MSVKRWCGRAAMGTETAATNPMVEWCGDPDNDTPYVLASDYDADVAALQAALITVLPMAKGYASEHPVGRNAEMVAEAEVVLTGNPLTKSGSASEPAIIVLERIAGAIQAAIDGQNDPERDDELAKRIAGVGIAYLTIALAIVKAEMDCAKSVPERNS